MEQLLLINPRRRTKKRYRRRAKNSRRRPRRAAGGFRIRRRRVKNPRSHRRHRRHRNPIMRRRHRRHRNPISMSGIKSAIMPAAIGAAGGIALDVAWNYLSPYVPASLTTSQYMVSAVKIAAAFGLGLVARKFLGSEKGNAVMAGALTIQIYNLASFALAGSLPGLSGLGAYMPMRGLGSTSPATYLQGPRGMGRVGRVGAYLRQPAMMGSLSGFDGMPGSMSTDMM
jgi:hypothetical protein